MRLTDIDPFVSTNRDVIRAAGLLLGAGNLTGHPIERLPTYLASCAGRLKISRSLGSKALSGSAA